METIEHNCPYCGTRSEEDEDISASHNCCGMWYNLWCPKCGAIARWYDRDAWPIDKDRWKIGKLALMALEGKQQDTCE